MPVVKGDRIGESQWLNQRSVEAQDFYAHLVTSKVAGGSNDQKNLWPKLYLPLPGAHQKDIVENHLHAEVCAGTITLAEAQHQIATDWLKVYQGLSSRSG